MKRFLDGLCDGAMAQNMAIASLTVGVSWSIGLSQAIAQPSSVMQIPVPAPQNRGTAAGGRAASMARPGPVVETGDVLAGEPLAMPEETVPLGRWSGQSGVKEVALAEMPWMGGAGYGIGYGTAAVAPAQYRVVVATPSEVHVDALKRIMPDAIALPGGPTMQAGAFADWRRANALQRALGAYGFIVEIQGL